MLLIRCFGLSLSDQYWMKPEKSGMTWEQINFFDHSFSDDIGDVLFGNTAKTDAFDFFSPDNTSDGCLKKRWKIMHGRRCLIKGGSNPFHQQPFNEVIAAGIMQRLGIRHVSYRLLWSEGFPYSVCEDFITRDTELVSAWRVMQIQSKSNHISVWQHFVDCCQTAGIDIVPDLDRMIVTDYIIANEDRHLNNFGLVRNARTLQWMGFMTAVLLWDTIKWLHRYVPGRGSFANRLKNSRKNSWSWSLPLPGYRLTDSKTYRKWRMPF